ncbi:P-loop containing nucleoside triphosphate hydrolase protein [Crucibulum laeve]|uniref:P-loop containing nucleoside triphosphate hydrolase protein n=1 Tax=Crucibulum laeve TaxID=68775 RepID=A0A5C3LGZ0_9AGAR|nr:P-loop containing nucleoside triphosphate hydrolase protein [Crucibulum laeve]
MQLDRDLRALGAGMYFDLPRIAVIGSQSAGKSSLVEGVSGINVPRDSGTCTRCPMECTMSSSSTSWSCSITLRIEYDPSGNPLGASTAIPFGSKITSKSQVEIWLRRAQAAVLNPHLSPEEFYTKSEAELKQAAATDVKTLMFSKNVVCVHVNDPDVTDLSFVDLPGLIQNSDQQAIDLVNDLVVSHIQGENTLILITIPMSDDMENQRAVVLARNADPDGERTIGILTKPDTLGKGDIGARQKWKTLLDGGEKKHYLKHGYYCVRLPNDEERGKKMSRAEAHRIASEFFDSTTPWNTVADRNRFGIPNFVDYVSWVLVKMIENNLPKLRQSVDGLLQDCIRDLNALPPLPSRDPVTEILLRVNEFCSDFQKAVAGEKYKQLAQMNRARYARFKVDILKTSPDFRPFVDHKEYHHPGLPNGKSAHMKSAVPAKNLMDVKEVIAKSIGWELPGHVPFEATKKLVLESTKLWRAPSLECFHDIFRFASDMLDELVCTHFGQFKLLENYVRSLVHVELEQGKEEAVLMLNKMLELESEPLFTQNLHYLQASEEKWLSFYQSVRRRSPSYLRNQPIIDWQPSYTHQPDTDGDDDEEEETVEPKDEYYNELVVMANVRAYFQVGYKRIIDYVPLTIEHGLNQDLASRLPKSLLSSLFENANATENMKELLSEDPAITVKRKFLDGRKMRLLQIKEKLDGFKHASI